MRPLLLMAALALPARRALAEADGDGGLTPTLDGDGGSGADLDLDGGSGPDPDADRTHKLRKRRNRRRKRAKASKSSKRGDRDTDKESTPTPRPTPGPTRPPGYTGARPTPPPTPPPGDGDFRRFTDGDDHTLNPDRSYSGIYLENGSHLTIESGVRIEADGNVYNRDSAIHVSDSSLKMLGGDIEVVGSSYEHDETNNVYRYSGVGGHAISFMEGSKGLIGCAGFEPPRSCSVGPAVPSHMSYCASGEFCMLKTGVCNSRIGMHSGLCRKVPYVCTLEMDPVCGCDGRDYSNSCGAHASGVSVSRRGYCDGGPVVGEGEDCEAGRSAFTSCARGLFCEFQHRGMCPTDGAVQEGKCARLPDRCPSVEMPVCGCDGKTYGNECRAKSIGVNVAHDGICLGPGLGETCEVGPRASLICERGLFCELEDGACPSDRSGSGGIGKCARIPEACIQVEMPVCGCNGKTYGNKCKAKANGVNIAHNGRCIDGPTPTRQPTSSGRDCEVGPFVLPTCMPDEFCELDLGVCIRKVGSEGKDGMMPPLAQRGKCARRPIVCPKIRSPVCGCDGQTYGNECMARKKGVSVSHRGECRSPPTRPPTPSGMACSIGPTVLPVCGDGELCYLEEGVCATDAFMHNGRCALRPERCTEQYDPVCGCDGKTYSNGCHARMEGFSVLHRGECQDWPPPGSKCSIGKTVLPICAAGELCYLEEGDCAKDAFSHEGKCGRRPEFCKENYDPVCGCDGKTYSNECKARANGFSVLHKGECRDGPTPTKEPTSVPGRCEAGRGASSSCGSKEFCQLEEGTCAIRDRTQAGRCKKRPDSCNERHRPVCGCDGETYSNKCKAASEGISVLHQGECGDGPPSLECELDQGDILGRLTEEKCPSGQFCRLDDGVCIQRTDTFIGKCMAKPPACTSADEPVCGCDVETYWNECFAHDAGVSVMHQGECGGGGPTPTRPPTPSPRRCEVARGVLPICLQGEFCQLDDGVCNQRTDTHRGMCQRMPLDCPEIYRPVCGCDGRKYDNHCFAHSAGVSVSRTGEDCEGLDPPFQCGGDTCKDPGGECKPSVKCLADPCSNKGACGPGQKCNSNYCGGCHAVCTDDDEKCPGNQCRHPFSGECISGPVVRCAGNPCDYPENACGRGQECKADYCGGCHAVCTDVRRTLAEEEAPAWTMEYSGAGESISVVQEIETPSDAEGLIRYPPIRDPGCDDDGIRIIGGEGDPAASEGSGRGGVALRVYGRGTTVDVKGATLTGGQGSINGLAVEIAEAEVTIHSAAVEGDVLVAKRGKLNVHGGSFFGAIEVLGDGSSVFFHGCVEVLQSIEGPDKDRWSFRFDGQDRGIGVVVHDGGEVGWNDEGCDVRVERTSVGSPAESPAEPPGVFP